MNRSGLTDYALWRVDQLRRVALTMLNDQQRTADMYNQNQYDEVMARMGSTKPVVDRDPFLKAGRHDSLIVLSIETYNDQKWGKSARATFEIEKSTSMPAGSRAVKIWNLFKPSKFPTQATDADQYAQFLCKLQGLPEGQHQEAARATLKTRAEGGNQESQPARGARIAGTGAEVGNPNPTTGQRYVRITWDTIPQDPGRIAQTRAQLDQRAPYQPMQQSAPMPQQGQTFAQQAMQPQTFAQQAMQPQSYAQQPVQYAPAPQQMLQVQPQQGYVQQPAAQPQPVVGAPAGGFLAMLPPK